MNILFYYYHFLIRVFQKCLGLLQMYIIKRSFDNPLVYYDIGALGGPLGRWGILAKRGLISYVGFEPNKSECARLTEAFPYAQYIDTALGDKESTETIYETRHPGCSSLLKPIPERFSKIPIGHWFDVVNTDIVNVKPLKQLIQADQVSKPDFISMDVQGYEYKVLLGLDQYISEVIGIELEAHFKPLYEGEEPFHIIYEYLNSYGFELVEIEPQGPYEGYLLEANFFFAKKKELLNPSGLSKLKVWEKANAIPNYYHRTKNPKIFNEHIMKFYKGHDRFKKAI